MKLGVLTLLLLSIASVGFTYPRMGRVDSVTLEPEFIFQTIPEAQNKTISELTLSEHITLASALSIKRQELNYVRSATMASRFLPGAGQFMTGNVGEGVAFLGVQTLITGATIAGVYLLTPANLWDTSASYGQLKQNYKDYANTVTPQELLPVIGVISVGMILSSINRSISSNRARVQAEENIANGSVTFEPLISLPTSGQLFFGVGMKMY